MSPNRSNQVDLTKAFNTVVRVLKQNQQALNAADEYNHNHGDNMVENFKVITSAVRAKKGSQPAEQLAYASQRLNQRADSGSAQVYAQGLAQAAERLQGEQTLTQQDALLLVQSLMGSGQAPAAQNQAAEGLDVGDLLGGLMGGQGQSSGGGELLGGLLGALMGGGQPEAAPAAQTAGGQPAAGGLDMGDLLNAGMAFFQARKEGAAPLDALVQAVMAGSQMRATAHRSQSGRLVSETLLTTLGSMLSGAR